MEIAEIADVGGAAAEADYDVEAIKEDGAGEAIDPWGNTDVKGLAIDVLETAGLEVVADFEVVSTEAIGAGMEVAVSEAAEGPLGAAPRANQKRIHSVNTGRCVALL